MPSFDLRIRFVGLCLFVPDPDRNQMHVLLPATANMADRPGQHAHGEEDASGEDAAASPHLHLPRLVYDQAHERANQKQLSRRLACHELERKAVLLTGAELGSAPPTLDLPDEMPDLDFLVGTGPVKQDAVKDDVEKRVTARVTLGTGAVTGYAFGASWTLKGSNPRRMTWKAEWTIRGIAGDFLPPIVLDSLSGGTASQTKKLFPIANTIHLTVYHVVPSELPPGGEFFIPELPTAEHVKGLYVLFKDNDAANVHAPEPVKPPLPVEVQCAGYVPLPEEERAVESIVTATTMTCIIGQAPVE